MTPSNRITHLVRSILAAALVGVSSFGSGCTADVEAPSEEPTRQETTTSVKDALPPEHTGVEGLSVASRGPRRLSVDRIERSIEVIASLPRGTVELDTSLAQTLGEPDYFRVTEESLEPSPLFMKFMLDLGGFACNAITDIDAARPAEDRVLSRYEDVDENIRHILLRFTGIEGAAAQDYIPRLREAYEVGRTGERPNGGWEAVCLAVFTSPEFLLY